MRIVRLTIVAACAALLWAGAALATPTPQENCDYARITAWKTYVSCIDTVVARDAGCATSSCPASFDYSVASAKCRHTYFKNWTAFQAKTSLATSTCHDGRVRFVDNGDETVTDNLTGLVWEKKTNDSSLDIHYAGQTYSWSTGSNDEDGTAFTTFLTGAGTGLNVAGFAGANGWRLPTLAELQTTVLDFPCTKTSCTCGSNLSNPCIDGTFGITLSNDYWSATSYVPDPRIAWTVFFYNGSPDMRLKSDTYVYVRAVRGGL